MALAFVDPTDPTKFQDLGDRVHLDEKWFFHKGEGGIGEDEPTCCV